MKKLLMFLSGILLWSFSVSAQRIIENPSYDARRSGIPEITRIELNPDNTRIHMKCTYSPKWWVRIDSTSYLQSSNGGQKFYPTEIAGTKFGKQAFTPASGHQTFVITYPPLPDSIKKIDYKEEEGTWEIFGISLSQDQAPDKIQLPEEIAGNWLSTDGLNEWTYGFCNKYALMGNQLWTYSDISRKGKTTVLTLNNGTETQTLCLSPQKDGRCAIGSERKGNPVFSRTATSQPISFGNKPSKQDNFFSPGKARLQGYMKGYDPRLGFRTGIIYLSNDIIDQDYPTVVRFSPDGRFEVELELNHPISTPLLVADRWIDFYIEPGQTLTMLFDWEDMIAPDRSPAQQKNPQPTKVMFMGPLGKINTDLQFIETLNEFNWQQFQKDVKQKTPEEFKKQRLAVLQRNQDSLTAFLKRNPVSPEAAELLQKRILMNHASKMLDFSSSRGYERRTDTTNPILKVPTDSLYYDFLIRMDLTSPQWLACPYFSTFINRLEFVDFLYKNEVMESYSLGMFMTYLEKTGANLTPEEQTLAKYVQSTDPNRFNDTLTYRLNKEKLDSITKKYSKEYETWDIERRVGHIMQNVERKDSLFRNYVHAEPGIIHDIIKLRSLHWRINNTDRAHASAIVNSINTTISHPFLKSEALRYLDQAYPMGKKTYPIPDTEAGRLFRKIMAPHKGNVVLVDFWSTGCGPCVYGIRNMKPLRDKYNGKGVSFVFITDENSSPLARYNEIMKDVEGDKLRLTEDQYNDFRELFRFNGIPHYVLVDQEGEVIDPAFNAYSFSTILPDLLKK